MLFRSLALVATRVLLALQLLCGQAMAAPSVSVPRDDIEIGIAPKRNLLFRKSSMDTISVEGLGRNEARKFLMLATGPESVSLEYKLGASFLGDIGDDGRFIRNSPFSSPQRYEDRLESYRRQSKTLWECMRYKVVDAGMRGLTLPRRQPSCNVERVDDATAYASGGLCFFGIDIGSSFTIVHEPNPACSSVDYLRSKGISPGEFHVFSGLYIAGDASGMSMDLSPLDSARLRFTLEPWSDVLPLTVDVGSLSLRWPAEVGLDAHAGAPRVFWANDGAASIETPLFVSNRCSPVCQGGNCVSRCEFPAAVGAQTTLSRLDGDRSTLLDIWFTGGLVPANWEGRLPGQHTLSYTGALEKGKRYRLEMDLSYPDTYYRMFRDGLKQMVIDLTKFSSNYSPAGLSGMPSLAPLSGMGMGALPGVPPLPTLGREGSLSVGFDGALDALQRLVKFETWPPYYERWCAQGRCASLRGRDSSVVLAVDFTVRDGGVGTEGVLGDFVVRRRSSFLPSYERRGSALPVVDVRPVDNDLWGR